MAVRPLPHPLGMTGGPPTCSCIASMGPRQPATQPRVRVLCGARGVARLRCACAWWTACTAVVHASPLTSRAVLPSSILPSLRPGRPLMHGRTRQTACPTSLPKSTVRLPKSCTRAYTARSPRLWAPPPPPPPPTPKATTKTTKPHKTHKKQQKTTALISVAASRWLADSRATDHCPLAMVLASFQAPGTASPAAPPRVRRNCRHNAPFP